jgi:oligopeptide transport system ATP-binding protein
MNNQNPEVLLRVEKLVKHFPIKNKNIFRKSVAAVHAVDGVSFTINKGETLGLVGESGCGKSTAGRTILQLQRPSSGHVYYDKQDLVAMKGEELRMMRRKMQMIFQDPYASLNPRLKVGDIVGEPLEIHKLGNKAEIKERVEHLLDIVGLDVKYANRFPHEFSGGQRQRVGIARALALNPDLIVCDEPISALDVSIQAQVINLLEDLQNEFELTYLFIAHDLSMVRHISDRVAVMYLGIIVELANCNDLYQNPLHPYTQALMSAAPIPDPLVENNRKRIVLIGDVPSPVNPPSGCRFHTRCPIAEKECKELQPEWREVTPSHFVACHLVP